MVLLHKITGRLISDPTDSIGKLFNKSEFEDAGGKLMNRVLCSTGALIGPPNGWDFALLRAYADKLECDGYEFLMYGAWHENADDLRRLLKNFPASIPVFHVEKRVGDLISRNEAGDAETALKLFQRNCALARDIEVEKLVVHLWGGLDSDKDIAHNFAYYKYLREISDSYGLVLTVENVVCNERSPMYHMRSLKEILTLTHCFSLSISPVIAVILPLKPLPMTKADPSILKV